MNAREVIESMGWVIPEIVLGGVVLLVILFDLVRARSKAFTGLVALGGIALAGAAAAGYLAYYPSLPPFWRSVPSARAPLSVFQGALAVDGPAVFFKFAFLGAAFLTCIFSIPSIRTWRAGRGEFFALLLSCTLGMMLMAGANDLLMMYLSLEFVSVTGYVLSGFLPGSRKGAEASLKYVVFGAAASGFMVYGMTFLYGLTGTLRVDEIGRRLAGLDVLPTMSLVVSVLVLAGFAYKVAAVPFHLWCPDVYEGAPTPVTAFFSVGPKAAGFAMLLRFLHGVFPPGEPGPFEWRIVLALMAVLTMAVGNLGALHQQNLKRLLAYSSIAHAGYILIAFTIFTPESAAAVMFYIAVYIVMNLGAFVGVIVLEERHGVETVEECRGMGWRAPWLGVLMAVFLFSLTGLPPTAGFVGKVLIFSSLIRHGLEAERALGISLVIVAVAFTVVSLFYYARIIAAMFLSRPREEAAAPPEGGGRVHAALLWFLAIATVGLGLFWGPLQRVADAAARSIHS